MVLPLIKTRAMPASEYDKKRDFSKTREPKGGSKKAGEQPIFVVQKHQATNLHYDFRLEIGGSLKSWSVPKGPSTDPSVKRMAIPTEDHPLEYADFEGTIPEGEYGGGTVMVWDRGTFKNIKADKEGRELSLLKSYELGTLEVDLHGEKIYGGYALVRMNSGEMKGNWLLIKTNDDRADARRNPTSTENKSVLSGRSMEEITAQTSE
jgi:DNA ligase D-like protein (predicted 3'-phosphoesterase)